MINTKSFAVRGLLWLIKIYQKGLSPLLPARCRYYPTCSEYGRQALLWHGFWRGGRLLVWRLLRCQPFGGSGIDFVPVPMWRYRFVVATHHHQLVYVDKFSYVTRLNYLCQR